MSDISNTYPLTEKQVREMLYNGALFSQYEKAEDIPEALVHLAYNIAHNHFKHGYERALRAYAWWKDGTQQVGSGVYSLEQAIDKFREEQARKVSGLESS